MRALLLISASYCAIVAVIAVATGMALQRHECPRITERQAERMLLLANEREMDRLRMILGRLERQGRIRHVYVER